MLPKALVVGLVAGLLASAFRVALQLAEHQRVAWLGQVTGLPGLLLAVGLGVIGGGLGVWLVRRFYPEASGSGIPHLQSVVLGERTMNWRRLLPVKFVAGVCGIGGGLALGREGPTIQMGGGVGLMVSEWFRVKPGEGERKALIAAGAGAGLAAAFNAPLAGLIFVLEELHGGFTPIMFVAAFLASVTADVVGRVLTGEMPVFPLRDLHAPGVGGLPVALLIGGVCGFAGVGFNRSLLKTLDLFQHLKRWPAFALGALAGVVVGVASWVYPGVAGSGGIYVERALAGEVAMHGVVLLILLRFALTMISYGSGAAGGIFAPLLVIGALGGLALGHAAHAIAPGLAPVPAAYAVIGMGALLTAIVRVPLTSVVLLIELTGQYEFMLPLLTASLAAYGVAEYLGDTPIYEALRQRAGRATVPPPAEPERSR
jgi:chloride channel protein, CIC family